MSDLNDHNIEQPAANNEDISKDLNDLKKLADVLFSAENLNKLSSTLEQNNNPSLNTDLLNNLNGMNGLGSLTGLNPLNGLNTASLFTGVNGLGSVFKQLTSSDKKQNELNDTLKEILDKLNQMENKNDCSHDNSTSALLNEINGRLYNLQAEINASQSMNQNVSRIQSEMEFLKKHIEDIKKSLNKAIKKKKKD